MMVNIKNAKEIIASGILLCLFFGLIYNKLNNKIDKKNPPIIGYIGLYVCSIL